MPKISVIIPVYKVEQYLDRCVESVLAQTFKDFELILVDDGSPDNCPQMCDEWAKKDARIRVIHQENQGQSVARNNALDIARGEYISFVDSDDYVHPRFLEILYQNIISTQANVSVCEHARVFLERITDFESIDVFSPKIYIGKDFTQKSLAGEVKGIWFLWDKLYHRRCFENLRLPTGRIYEDNATVYKILYESEKVVACDDVLYYYFANENSTVLQNFQRKHLDWLLVPQEMIEYFTQKNEPILVDKANKMYLSALEDMLKKVRNHLNDKNLEKELQTKLINQYKSEKKKYPITVKTHPSLYESLYPIRMKLYWTFKGITNKLFKR